MQTDTKPQRARRELTDTEIKRAPRRVKPFLAEAVALAGDKMSSDGISGLSFVLTELHRSLEYAEQQA